MGKRLKYRSPDAEKLFCCYCEKWIIFPLIETFEHLVPVSLGGNDSKRNKKTCCHYCNELRSNKSLDVWAAEVRLALKDKVIIYPFDFKMLKVILKNIEHWNEYVRTEGDKLLKQRL